MKRHAFFPSGSPPARRANNWRLPKKSAPGVPAGTPSRTWSSMAGGSTRDANTSMVTGSSELGHQRFERVVRACEGAEILHVMDEAPRLLPVGVPAGAPGEQLEAAEEVSARRASRHTEPHLVEHGRRQHPRREHLDGHRIVRARPPAV